MFPLIQDTTNVFLYITCLFNHIDAVCLTIHLSFLNFHPYYLNVHPFEIVSRWRDPQLQVCENNSHLFNLFKNIDVDTHHIPVMCQLKNELHALYSGD